jgi:hypothetical protein
VVAVPLAEGDAERLARQDWTEENCLLYEMAQTPEGSLAAWAGLAAGPQPPARIRPRCTACLRPCARTSWCGVTGRWALTADGLDEARRALDEPLYH